MRTLARFRTGGAPHFLSDRLGTGTKWQTGPKGEGRSVRQTMVRQCHLARQSDGDPVGSCALEERCVTGSWLDSCVFRSGSACTIGSRRNASAPRTMAASYCNAGRPVCTWQGRCRSCRVRPHGSSRHRECRRERHLLVVGDSRVIKDSRTTLTVGPSRHAMCALNKRQETASPIRQFRANDRLTSSVG